MYSLFLERPGGQEQVTGPSALLLALLGHHCNCRKQIPSISFSIYSQMLINWRFLARNGSACWGYYSRQNRKDGHILYSNKYVSDMNKRRTGHGEEKERSRRGVFIPDGWKGVGEQ